MKKIDAKQIAFIVVIGIFLFFILFIFKYSAKKPTFSNIIPIKSTPNLSTTSTKIQLTSCVIFDKKPCIGEIVKIKDSFAMGFSLPVGTKVFAPTDGFLGEARIKMDPQIPGRSIKTVTDDNTPILILMAGRVQFIKPDQKVAEGQEIGTITDEKGILGYKFNFFIAVAKFDKTTQKYVPSEEALKEVLYGGERK